MFLQKAYGKGTIAAASALLMYFSMVINQSLVARTFGTYSLQLFDTAGDSWLVPLLSVGLLLFALAINIAGNRLIGTFSLVMSVLKIGGIVAFGFAGFTCTQVCTCPTWLLLGKKGCRQLNVNLHVCTCTSIL